MCRLLLFLIYKRPPLLKGDVYEVDWGIFENFVNHYKVESEDVVNLKQSPELYALSSEL